MERQHVTTLVVLVAVLLAGCGGSTPDAGTATPTATDTPTPTATPAPTDTPEPTATPTQTLAYPDGWSESGIDDPQTALDSHYRAVLAGPSTTVRYRSEVVESSNGTLRNTTLDMRFDTESERLFAEIVGRDGHREVYFANGTFSQWDVANETMASQSETQFGLVAQSVDRQVLLSHLLLYEVERTGSVQHSGVTAHRYEVTGVHPNTLSNAFGSATSGSGHIVVTQNGRVLELETTVTYERATVQYRYDQTDFRDTAVPTPDWAQA